MAVARGWLCRTWDKYWGFVFLKEAKYTQFGHGPLTGPHRVFYFYFFKKKFKKKFISK